MNLNTCYTILGIEADADGSRAKRAYKTQVKRWHPDRFPDGSDAQSAAEERLKQINIAYARVKAHLSTRRPASATAAGTTTPPSGRRTAPDKKPSGRSTASRSWIDHLFTMLASVVSVKPDRPSAQSSQPTEPSRQKNFGQVLNEMADGAPGFPSPGPTATPTAENWHNNVAYGHRRHGGSGAVGGIRPVEPVKPVRRVRGIGKSR
jgi:curved DNA-binding protein CbpA